MSMIFLIILSYLILISRRVVNDPILYSYCAEFGIFVKFHVQGMFVFCLTAASGTTVLLDYIANIIWNIDIPPMINKSL